MLGLLQIDCWCTLATQFSPEWNGKRSLRQVKTPKKHQRDYGCHPYCHSHWYGLAIYSDYSRCAFKCVLHEIDSFQRGARGSFLARCLCLRAWRLQRRRVPVKSPTPPVQFQGAPLAAGISMGFPERNEESEDTWLPKRPKPIIIE